jgi:hypothetical protein
MVLAWLMIVSMLPAQKVADPWKFLVKTKDYTVYYNPKSIVRTDDGTVKLSLKDVPVDRTAAYIKRSESGLSTKGYEDFDYDNVQWEFDCKKQQVRILAWADYDSHGTAISSSIGATEWAEIAQDILGARLSAIACK